MSAAQLLADNFFCDGHADTFRNVMVKGTDFVGGVGGDHLNLERLQQARQNLQIMAIYIPKEETGPQATVSALRIAQEAHRAVERAEGRLALVRDSQDLGRCQTSSHPWIMLSLEGADPLGGDLNLLDLFYRLGLRAIGLTHNHNSCAAGGCDPPDGIRTGLSDFGKDLVREMTRRGMLLDTAHLARQAFDEVLALGAGPVVNSHSCCASLVPMERNLADQQIRDLAATGGLAAVTYVPRFLKSDAEKSPPSSQDVFRHLEHMVEVAGIDHVALGSDFDGVEKLPTDLQGPGETVNLVARMQEAGWTPSDIGKVLGGNWLRVLRSVLR